MKELEKRKCCDEDLKLLRYGCPFLVGRRTIIWLKAIS